jgi:hypothetical protein
VDLTVGHLRGLILDYLGSLILGYSRGLILDYSGSLILGYSGGLILDQMAAQWGGHLVASAVRMVVTVVLWGGHSVVLEAPL